MQLTGRCKALTQQNLHSADMPKLVSPSLFFPVALGKCIICICVLLTY